MKSEIYFFKYAFPCAQVLLDRGTIDEKKYQELYQLFLKGQAPKREEIERLFATAIKNLRLIAKELDKDSWDIEVLKRYFLEDHNKYIMHSPDVAAKYGKGYKDVCQVYIAEVISRQGRILTVKTGVKPGSKTTKVLGDIVPNAMPGDKVSIHLGFAVEIL